MITWVKTAYHKALLVLEISERLKFLYFFFQDLGVHDNAVADNAICIVTEYSRRDKMKDDFFIADHDRMAGICPALETNNDIGLTAQVIYNFSLAFIAPLNPDNSHIGHLFLLRFHWMEHIFLSYNPGKIKLNRRS